MDDLKKELEYREQLARITRVIQSAPDTDSLLAAAQDKICELRDAERITIHAGDPRTNQLRSVYQSGEGLKAIEVTVGHRSLAGSDRMRSAIQERSKADDLREIGKAEGMTTLLQDGVQKIFGGRTDLKQVRAVCLR